MEQKNYTSVIAITGPESSGKSYTSEYLAKEFNAWIVPEFARIYLEQIKRGYTYDDVLKIAHGHIVIENDVVQNGVGEDIPLIIFDTELINYKIWCDIKYGKCEKFIIDGIRNSKIEHYLLMKPDIQWKEDKLREDKNNRDFLFEKYLEELNYFEKTFTIIDGEYAERLKIAKAITRTFIL